MRIVLDIAESFGFYQGEITMTTVKQTMLKREDRRVSRAIIGVLTAPIGLLAGMGFLIAI
jgi:hypothetical protein